jgi:ABC-type multidrug transport system ATPase subunit
MQPHEVWYSVLTSTCVLLSYNVFACVNTQVAVRNMWLGIPKGQCFGLLGINGAGKTTAISTLCGEQTPTEGRATLAGIPIYLHTIHSSYIDFINAHT